MVRTEVDVYNEDEEMMYKNENELGEEDEEDEVSEDETGLDIENEERKYETELGREERIMEFDKSDDREENITLSYNLTLQFGLLILLLSNDPLLNNQVFHNFP